MRFLNNILLTLKTIKNIKLFLLDYFGLLSGDVIYQIKNSQLKFITRSGTPDIDEVIMVNSGFEYRLSEISARKNLVIFDVGAHVGSFSIHASSFFKKLKPSIYAFEPDKDNYKYLNLNMALNDLGNIPLFNLAIGNYDGDGYLKTSNMQNDAYFLTHTKDSGKNNCIVKTIFTVSHELKIKKIDILKLDIEGGEYDIFRDAKSLQFIANNVEYIILEHHNVSKTVNFTLIEDKLNKHFNLIHTRDNVLIYRNKKRLIP